VLWRSCRCPKRLLMLNWREYMFPELWNRLNLPEPWEIHFISFRHLIWRNTYKSIIFSVKILKWNSASNIRFHSLEKIWHYFLEQKTYVDLLAVIGNLQRTFNIYIKGKVHFWPSNFCLSLVLAIELQNRTSLTIKLLKPFTIDHRAVLIGSFNFFIYNLVLRTWNDHYFLLVAPI
jgi:hypothetical protein